MEKVKEISIIPFKAYYRAEIKTAFDRIAFDEVTKVIEMIARAVKMPKSTIYVLGNGGSTAVARHFGTSLQQRCMHLNYGTRFNYGINMHVSQAHANANGYENIFSNLLAAEHADKNDLAILISGSGDSDNILQAAAYCRKHHIPCIGFSGFDGGKMAKLEMDYHIIANTFDQQTCEDVVQALMHMIIEQVGLNLLSKPYNFAAYTNYIEKLLEAMDKVPAKFLFTLSEAIVHAFNGSSMVYVLGPEGQGLSLSAEHTAHNLNWDAVFEIKDPPRRHLASTPTDCDFSGIGNDRLLPGIVSLQQLDRAKPGDILLCYSHNPTVPAVRNTINKAIQHGMKIFLISGDARLDLPGIEQLNLGTETPEMTADIAQSTGHMTGRLVRLRIKLNSQGPIPDITQFLINGDLAQRRLILEREGL
jgi:D-sedoheptulose 7-phosphate isomerase